MQALVKLPRLLALMTDDWQTHSGSTLKISELDDKISIDQNSAPLKSLGFFVVFNDFFYLIKNNNYRSVRVTLITTSTRAPYKNQSISAIYLPCKELKIEDLEIFIFVKKLSLIGHLKLGPYGPE